jgi:SHOCT-like domain
MFTQTFRASQPPQVRLVECTGKLIVEPWDERDIAVEAEIQPEHVELEGETLVIRRANGDLLLRVPADTTVAIAGQRGDVTARGIHALGIEHAEGSVQVAAIGGEVRLRDIYGKTSADDVESLVIERDTRPHQHRLRKRLRREIDISNTRTIEIAEASDDLTITMAQRVAVGPVGGNATVREVAGELRTGTIGGNAYIRATTAVLQIGNIGGNLTLDAAPLTIEVGEHAGRLVVGGNARLEFPDDANLAIHATLGGKIHGAGINSTFAGGMATISYGAGAVRLDLIVGGNLELSGGTPEISSALWGGPARASSAKRRPPEPTSARGQRGVAPEPGVADQRRAILRLVADGRISAEEAERRLDALDRG